MTDWELHDHAVQVVRGELQKDGKRLMSWTGDPRLDPAIWFVGDAGPEWIVVRAARYPAPTENLPAHWKQIAERSAKLGKEGTFLSLSVASSPDAFDPGGAVLPEPLWRGHLERPSNRALDPGLFDLLRQVRKRSPRTVRDLRPALPGASFVEEYVPTGVIRRAEWFAQSKDALRGKETIFLDPDNGIASGKLATGSKRAMKSVFMTEIKSLHQAGHSLVIYHHATRWQKGVTVPQQAAQLAEWLHQSGAQTVLPVISRRGTVRIFLVTNVNLACRAAVGHFAERWRDNIDPVQEFVADPYRTAAR